MSKFGKKPVEALKLEDHFGDQLEFLRKSCSAFDLGETTEYRRIATTLRLLFHSTQKSKSLIENLNFGHHKFFSYAKASDPNNLMPEFDLAVIEVSSSGSKFAPVLGRAFYSPRSLEFQEWWCESVLRDCDRVHLSRFDLVTIVANQDGGAHVDPEIDARYHRLINENSIGFYSDEHQKFPIVGIERVYLRHIAYEALLTLEPLYIKLLGNRACLCGSGRKARYCCHRDLEKSEILEFERQMK